MSSDKPIYDVVVAGTGASGLVAAVTAHLSGLKVLIVEKEPVVGGTTALSGGVSWIPGNTLSAAFAVGGSDSRAKVMDYIQEQSGNYFDQAKAEAFLDAAPEMLDFLRAKTAADFAAIEYPDYHSESRFASDGRGVAAADYRAKALGKYIKQLKKALPQTTFFGFAVGSGVEMVQFIRAGRSFKSLLFVAKKMGRHFWDLAIHREPQQIVRGRALVARLFRTVLDLGIDYRLNTPIERLVTKDGRVTGCIVDDAGQHAEIGVRKGVILACGGFTGDAARRDATFPAAIDRGSYRSITPAGNTGDGIRIAEAVGGVFDANVSHPGAWMPVSALPKSRDYTGVWPHLIERQKPGVIAVLPSGRRFGNEATSYHDMVPDLVRATPPGQPAMAWLVADAEAFKKWGLGHVRPFPVPHGRHLRSGYLKRGRDLADLARQCGIDPSAFEDEVRSFNKEAAEGRDSRFDRGVRTYDYYQGDPDHRPNANLGPLTQAPFYAVKIQPGDIGTFAGLSTDAKARVLDTDGRVIEGLYAVGNDQRSVFGGAYPGPGSTLGPAMTFGYIAALHAAGRAAS